MSKKKKVESVTAMGKRKRELIEQAYLKEKAKNLNAIPGPLAVTLVLDHMKPDFNVGKIFRSADIFGCREVWLVGIPFFDVGPARGSFRHVPARMAETLQQALDALLADGYTVYALDPREAELTTEVSFPEKTALIVGNEGAGLSVDIDAHPEIRRLRIPQYGQAESLNASVAASIALYEYARAHAGELPLSAPKRDRRERNVT